MPPRSRPGRGRPVVFIPVLVVQRAAQLYAEHRRWSTVLEQLEREGNGSYARNTLIRRVEASTAVQNPRELEQLQPRRRRPRAVSKKRR